MTFVPRWILGDLDLTEAPFLSFPEDYGYPENVSDVVDSLLADGSVVTSDRTDNRTIQHTVWIEEADSTALALAEALLVAECDRERNTFTVEPGDGFGHATVFDTFRVQAKHVLNMDEERAGLRRYDLTIPALPFARSVDEVVVTAAPSSSTPTTLDDGTSTANWSSTGGISVTAVTYDSQSAIRFAGVSGGGSFSVTYAGAGPSQPFTFIDVFGQRTVLLNSVAPIAVEPLSGTFFRRYWFNTPTVTTPLTFFIEDVGAEAHVSTLGSGASVGLASLLVAPVYGSVRTTGRFTVTASSPMNWCALYTDPAMRNGAYHPAIPGTWANAPEGVYTYWTDPFAATITVTVTDSVGQVQTMVATGQWTNSVTGQTHPDLVPIGELTLGGNRNGLVGALTIVTSVSGVGVITPTRQRLYRKSPDTSLTHALLSGAGSGASTSLIVESPSVDRPFGGVWDGTGASVVGKCLAWEDPTFAPEETFVFAESHLTSGTLTVTAGYYPRHHTHATR